MTFDNDWEALEYLRGHGIREVRNGVLSIPKSYQEYMPGDIREAIWYLLDEWDFDTKYE